MSSIAGRALVADFDGTLLTLAVDWSGLRRSLGVQRIAELWSRGDRAFDPVDLAEVEGARTGTDRAAALAFVRKFSSFAVLTDNTEAAVRVFLERHPQLARRCLLVAGRETLAGSKQDVAVFERGARMCLEALRSPVAGCAYLGDQQIELSFARSLGFQVTDVAWLGGSAGR